MELNSYVISMFVAAAITFLVGLYGYKKVKNVQDYYVMGRNASMFLIAGTFFATWLSVVTFVGEVGLGWHWGMPMTLWTYASLWGATIFALLIGIPLRRGEFLTGPDYFAERFNSKRMRMFAVICLLFGLLFYAIGQITGASIVIEHGTGLPYQYSVIIMTIVVAVYLAAGGMYAVIWTDTLMYVTMVIGGLIAFPLVLKAVGGWYAVTHTLPKMTPGIWSWNGPQNFSLSFCLGNALVWLGVTASAPHLMTRAYAAKDEKTFMNGMLLGSLVAGIFLILIISLGQFAGLKIPAGSLTSRDYVMPFIATNLVPTAVGCLLFAGIMVAAMSTINTQILTVGQAFVKDIYKDFIKPDLSFDRVTKYTRVAVIIIALCLGALSLARPATVYVIGRWGGGIFCCTYLPVLLLSLYWKRITEKGAFYGGCIGFILYTVLLTQLEWKIGMAAFADKYLFTANIWAALVNTATIIVVSLITAPSEKEKLAGDSLLQKMFPPPNQRVFGEWPKDYVFPIMTIVIAIAFIGVFSYFMITS